MKICLIDPPKFVSLSNPVSTVAMPPIGLAYVAGSLEAAGHDVTVVDSVGSAPREFFSFGRMRVRGLGVNEIVARVPSDAGFIGVSLLFSSYWPLVRELIRALRTRFPRTPLVLGGEHGTGMPKLSLQQTPLDVVVLGEGEETAIELARVFEQGGDLASVSGIAYRLAGEIVVNPRRNRRRGVDDIPLPAWHLFDIEAYIATNQPHGAPQGRFMPMLATRGCPFQCTFCTSPQMWTQLWLPRNPVLVVDEIELYQAKYGAVDFQFEDLTAIVRKDWIVKFCDEILRRGLKITFQLPSGTRSEAIDAECAQKLKAAGCHEFAFAPESGDPRILKAIKKQVDLDHMFESARAAMAAGINVGCFFIVGFREDDYLSVFRTYKAIAKCAWMGFSNVSLSAYSPQPNTQSFRALQAEGLIPELDDEYLLNLFTYQDFGARKKSYNPRFSDWTLTAMVLGGFLTFYAVYFLRRPQRLVHLLIDVVGGTARNKTTKMARSIIRDGLRIARHRLGWGGRSVAR